LVELLISITILSIVLTMVYTILVSTLNARKAIEKATEVDKIGGRLISLITRDLQAIYFYEIEGQSLVSKKGKNGLEINFVTTNNSFVSSQDMESDLCEVGYALLPNDEEPGLFWLVRREDFFIDEEPMEGGKFLKLYDRVFSWNIKFYDQEQKKHDFWDSKEDKGFPSCIEIEIKIPETTKASSREDMLKSLCTLKACIPIVVSSSLPEKEKTPSTESGSH
jgi:hypothetical protein